jgi:RimJ/RimL family protein N-acetyltransferase
VIIERVTHELWNAPSRHDGGDNMIKGTRILLRPIRDEDWPLFEEWGKSRDALWGPYQRYRLDHLPMLREAYRQTGLLKRESGFLLIETLDDHRVVGFVRYTLIQFPDADLPQPEIGFGITDVGARGQGFAAEAVKLAMAYLFAGYPAERISALTDAENAPAQRLLEALSFRREGVVRRTMFRDGHWRDVVLYGILREEWKPD